MFISVTEISILSFLFKFVGLVVDLVVEQVF